MPNTDSSAHPQGLTSRVTLTICLPTCSPWRRRTFLQLTVKTAKGQMLSFPSVWIFCSGISGMRSVRGMCFVVSVAGRGCCTVAVTGVARRPWLTAGHGRTRTDRLLRVPCPGHLSRSCACARDPWRSNVQKIVFIVLVLLHLCWTSLDMNGLARDLGHMIKAFSF